jgi:hypothetical protein
MAGFILFAPPQIESLQQVYKLAPSVIESIAKRLAELPNSPLAWGALCDEILKAAGNDAKSGDLFIEQILPLSGRMRIERCSAQEIVDAVEANIGIDFFNTELVQHGWKRISRALVDVFSLPVIYLSASALELSYEHADIFRGVRILTDIRPIFNHDATSIQGAVVTHTLRLRYENTQGRQEFVLALDETDVQQVIDDCNRALAKSKIARKLMSDEAGVPTVISGAVT